MNSTGPDESWGKPPWQHDVSPKRHSLPREVDVAIVGGGFAGLAAAAWLRRWAAEKVVAVFERYHLGSGGSGRTGGIVLGETATGDLPGLGNVLEGFKSILDDLGVQCGAVWNGVYEIAHGRESSDSVLQWEDSGPLRVAKEVPGGAIDAGQLIDGLARTAEHLGALLFENTPAIDIHFDTPIRLELSNGEVYADQVLLAANACALELSGLESRAQPKFTLVVATEPLKDDHLEAIGLGDRKPFYTVDLPYLWGRTLRNDGVIFGSGLVHVNDWRELDTLDILTGESARLLASLKTRVRGLHPILQEVKFSHQWGGPILFPDQGSVFFHAHPFSPNAIVVGGYTGQGVALAVHLGRWAAEVFLGERRLPAWGKAPALG